jgi:hypothetical protein
MDESARTSESKTHIPHSKPHHHMAVWLGVMGLSLGLALSLNVVQRPTRLDNKAADQQMVAPAGRVEQMDNGMEESMEGVLVVRTGVVTAVSRDDRQMTVQLDNGGVDVVDISAVEVGLIMEAGAVKAVESSSLMSLVTIGDRVEYDNEVPVTNVAVIK